MGRQVGARVALLVHARDPLPDAMVLSSHADSGRPTIVAHAVVTSRPFTVARSLLIALVLACGSAPVAADHVDQALLEQAGQLTLRDLPALEQRASRGDAEAAILLGEVHHHGRIVARDDAAATAWFTRAADTGVPLAQYWLARKHDLGDALSRDQAIAADLYRRAAEQGYANAQNRLGELYARGLGVDQDFGEALRWFGRAATQRHPEAISNLAAMHYHGRGVDRDYRQAFVLFQTATLQGNEAALLILGNMALHGLGTERSLVHAYKFYALASLAHSGDERTAELAESMLDRLGPHMSDVQIDEALSAAELWSYDIGIPVAVGPNSGLILLERPHKHQEN